MFVSHLGSLDVANARAGGGAADGVGAGSEGAELSAQLQVQTRQSLAHVGQKLGSGTRLNKLSETTKRERKKKQTKRENKKKKEEEIQKNNKRGKRTQEKNKPRHIHTEKERNKKKKKKRTKHKKKELTCVEDVFCAMATTIKSNRSFI